MGPSELPIPPMQEVARVAPRSALPWYLTSSSLWVAGMSLQGFLLTWMLVGILETPADRVGYGRALIELPALLVILLGGLIADHVDGRALLIRMHVLMTVPGLVIAWLSAIGLLGFWAVVAFGLAVSSLQAVTDPARQAMLSRVTRTDIQRTVTLMTIVTSLVGLGGVWLGGRLEAVGLVPILLAQAAIFSSGALAVRRLPEMPAIGTRRRRDLLGGLRAVAGHRLLRNVVTMVCVSSLFNAGAYIVAIPFIVTEVYAGNASMYSTVMIVFTVGSIGSNVVLLRFMPLKHPGRLFVVLQGTRAAILALLYVEPGVWLFYLAMLAWGTNMGVTSTLARTMVQELAPPAARAQVLAVFLLSFMISAPLSAIVLGNLIAGSSPLGALVPGIVVSSALLVVGTLYSGLWSYASDAAAPPGTSGHGAGDVAAAERHG